jgi:hypothetical protein
MSSDHLVRELSLKGPHRPRSCVSLKKQNYFDGQSLKNRLLKTRRRFFENSANLKRRLKSRFYNFTRFGKSKI